MSHVDYEVNYPTKFPMDAITDAARIVKNGLIAEEKACFKKDVWIVDGYVSLQVFGEPTDHPLIGSVATTGFAEIQTEAEFCNAVDDLVKSQTPAVVADGEGVQPVGAAAINPLQLLAIAKFLHDLWKQFKDK